MNDAYPRPIRWCDLTPEEAPEEWDALRHWVEQLATRFPYGLRLPECWWRHNDLVEALAALRDFERASFSPAATASAPVEWHRALRDMETRMESWIRRFTCSVPGRGHESSDRGAATDDAPSPAGWEEFVTRDVHHRQQRAEIPDADAV